MHKYGGVKMKVLIWVCGALFIVLVTMLCENAGIVLGGIPTGLLYGCTAWLVLKLTKNIDKKKGKEQQGQ